MRNTASSELLFDLSQAGRRGLELPPCDVPERAASELLPAGALADAPPPLPELAEPDVVRHFVNLSTLNMSVDTHFYPLGSCTMKYNPKRNERLAGLPGLLDIHPYQPDDSMQGLLELLYRSQEMLAEIGGLPAVSLQPSAGAHGEMTALLVAAAYFRDIGQPRTTVLIPDVAHGTNPASAAMAGFKAIVVKSTPAGFVDLDDLASKLDEHTAVFMITNPNTLGMFEGNIREIARRVHDAGGLVYLDGANMNAILGIARPGDFGVDVMHYNTHKTFSTPHGCGGPGAGPVAVREGLQEFLPGPQVVRREDGTYGWAWPGPRSIGRVRSFYGQIGVLIRAYAYIRALGPEGLRQVSEKAVLSANYLAARLREHYRFPFAPPYAHEFIMVPEFREHGVTELDVAKRLIDFAIHPPTMSWPVAHCLMIEPTETESLRTLDGFAETMIRIAEEARTTPEILHHAPHTMPVERLDEVTAARKPDLCWRESTEPAEAADNT